MVVFSGSLGPEQGQEGKEGEEERDLQVGTSLGPLRGCKPHRTNFSEGSAGSPTPGMYGLTQWPPDKQLGRESPMGQACQEGGVAQSGPASMVSKG